MQKFMETTPESEPKPPSKRRRVLIGIGLLLVALVAFQELIAPVAAKHIVRALITKECPSCRLELDSLRLRFYPPSLSVSGISFEVGAPESLEVKVRAQSVQASISPWRLLRKVIRLGDIQVMAPEVTVLEGDLPAGADTGKSTAGVDVEVDGIEVRNGAFTYLRRHAGMDAPISLYEIEAKTGPLGSTMEMRQLKASGFAKGRLESSGHFELSLESLLFAFEQNLDLDLLVQHQNLADVNRYFIPGEGVELRGVLEEGHGKVTLRGTHADSWVYAKYRELGFDIKKTEERSAFTAFLTNLLSSLVTRRDNREKDWLDRTQAKSIDREAKESLVSFILRALKSAALSIPHH